MGGWGGGGGEELPEVFISIYSSLSSTVSACVTVLHRIVLVCLIITSVSVDDVDDVV